jgi:hypothetical protein
MAAYKPMGKMMAHEGYVRREPVASSL